MKQRLKDIRNIACEFHNSKSIELRKMMSISSMETQITTLLNMKDKIKSTAKKECIKIDNWIKNIVRDLEQALNDENKESK